MTDPSIGSPVTKLVNVEPLVDSIIENQLITFCKNMHPCMIKGSFGSYVIMFVGYKGKPTSAIPYVHAPEGFYITEEFEERLQMKLVGDLL